MPSKGNPLAARKIGVAYANSLFGPWTRWGSPVFEASPSAARIDNSSVSNAAPSIAADGSVLLAYKGLGAQQPNKPPCTDGSGKACIFFARAPHWAGPYERLNLSVSDPNDSGSGTSTSTKSYFLGEDPTLWQSGANEWHARAWPRACVLRLASLNA